MGMADSMVRRSEPSSKYGRLDEKVKAQGSICKEKDLFVKILTGGRTDMRYHGNLRSF
jgi:hypothetical protein